MLGAPVTGNDVAASAAAASAQAVWGVAAAILHLGRVSVGEQTGDAGIVAMLHRDGKWGWQELSGRCGCRDWMRGGFVQTGGGWVSG